MRYMDFRKMEARMIEKLEEIQAQLNELLEDKRKRDEKERKNKIFRDAHIFSDDSALQDFGRHVIFYGNNEEQVEYNRLSGESPKMLDYQEALEKNDGSIDELLQKKYDVIDAIMDLNHKSNNRVNEENRRKSDEEYENKNSNNWFRRVFG